MKKGIGFQLNEKTYITDVVVEKGIYNGFGKMVSLPSKIEKQRVLDNFSPVELGDLFIEMGLKLKRLNKDITNLELNSRFIENPYTMGRKFNVELLYDEVLK